MCGGACLLHMCGALRDDTCVPPYAPQKQSSGRRVQCTRLLLLMALHCAQQSWLARCSRAPFRGLQEEFERSREAEAALRSTASWQQLTSGSA